MQFSLKPIFVGWIALLVQLPFQLFFTIWCGGFLGGLASSVWPAGPISSFVFFGAIAFAGIPLVAYVGKKLNYARTEYRFFSDRLEFEEGFFSLNRKVIKYRDVKEVTLREGILQRSVGLGTIYLAPLATGSGPRNNPFFSMGFGNVSASGIAVRDVQTPVEVYERVRKLVDASPG
jgi:membrane protein YdbS with pleckstrin-like domain